jgi:transcriptional regulator with XRE-family HTH domain
LLPIVARAILLVSTRSWRLSIPKVSIRQVKAARSLLAWSQEELANASGVSVPTIKRLEADDGELGGKPETAEKIVAALEAAGVEFTNSGQPGVKLRGHVFRLDPIDLSSPAWQASTTNSLVWVREDNPDAARKRVANRTLRAVPMRPGQKLLQSPWCSEKLTSCAMETRKTDVAFRQVVRVDGRPID